MQSKITNDSSNWRNKLNELELPKTDKQEVNDLWTRLETKKLVVSHKKHKARYWLVAAGLIVCLISARMISLSVQEHPLNKLVTSATKTMKLTTENTIPSASISIVEPIEKAKVVNKLHLFVSKRSLQKRTLKLVSVGADSASMTSQKVKLETIAPASVEPLIPGKAKMKLIKFNEINYKVNETAAEPSSRKPFFPINFPTRQTLTSSSGAGNADNLVKIKISSQN